MTHNHLENMFNFVKGLKTKNSRLSKYNSYKEYRKSFKGTLEDWQDEEGFTDKDKANFKEAFGDESY